MIHFYVDDYKLIRIEELDNIDLNLLHIYSEDNILKYSYEYIDNNHLIHLLNDIDIFKDNYVIYDDQKYKLEYRLIVQTPRFDKEVIPNLDRLGAFYSQEKTIFRVFAPFKKGVNLIINNQSYKMNLIDHFIYEYTLHGDLDGNSYHYELVDDEIINILDPFSYSNSETDSYIIDTNKIKNNPRVLSKTLDPIIYELSIRDFTSSYPFKYSKKIKGLIEEKSLNYLKALNISHIQIMPMLDYDDDKGEYNWGYNPTNYNVFKKAYLSDISAYGQIKEVQEVFNTLHDNNIKIVLDVIFNHVYSTENFILNKILPHYFYRYMGTNRANGTGLGNELRTESKFLREYLKIICLRLVDIYDIDGLRFDLSGFIDIETMNEIKKDIHKIKEDFLFIFEGWNMGEALPEDKRLCYENASKFKDGFFFNPDFRDTVKEYLLGKRLLKEKIKKIWLTEKPYLNYRQSLNYVECHDDETFYDYLKMFNIDNIRAKKLAKLALSLVILSKGIPFIHSGQEFMRSKNGIRNSYNLPDSINKFDWELMEKNKDMVNYVEDLISLRRQLDINKLDEGCFKEYLDILIYETNQYLFFFNINSNDVEYHDGGGYKVILDKDGLNEIQTDHFIIAGSSMTVAKKLY